MSPLQKRGIHNIDSVHSVQTRVGYHGIKDEAIVVLRLRSLWERGENMIEMMIVLRIRRIHKEEKVAVDMFEVLLHLIIVNYSI